MEALQGLELGGDAGGEGADGDVADVPQEVLDADFLGFFGFDDGGGVDEGFGGGGAVLENNTSSARRVSRSHLKGDGAVRL